MTGEYGTKAYLFHSTTPERARSIARQGGTRPSRSMQKHPRFGTQLKRTWFSTAPEAHFRVLAAVRKRKSTPSRERRAEQYSHRPSYMTEERTVLLRAKKGRASKLYGRPAWTLYRRHLPGQSWRTSWRWGGRGQARSRLVLTEGSLGSRTYTTRRAVPASHLEVYTGKPSESRGVIKRGPWQKLRQYFAVNALGVAAAGAGG